jgi:hypothetical protein
LVFDLIKFIDIHLRYLDDIPISSVLRGLTSPRAPGRLRVNSNEFTWFQLQSFAYLARKHGLALDRNLRKCGGLTGNAVHVVS